jgi:P27 family predicted phage terminase small subunit
VAPLLQETGVLREADLAALEDYCLALGELRRFETQAKKAGPELAIAKGYQGVVIKLRAQVNALRRELGMTPSARSGIRVAAKGEAKDQKVQRYLNALPGGRA